MKLVFFALFFHSLIAFSACGENLLEFSLDEFFDSFPFPSSQNGGEGNLIEFSEDAVALISAVWAQVPAKRRSQLSTLANSAKGLFKDPRKLATAKGKSLLSFHLSLNYEILRFEWSKLTGIWDSLKNAENFVKHSQDKRLEIIVQFTQILDDLTKFGSYICLVEEPTFKSLFKGMAMGNDLTFKLNNLRVEIGNLEVEINGRKQRLLESQSDSFYLAVGSGIFSAANVGIAVAVRATSQMYVALSTAVAMVQASVCIYSTNKYFVTAEIIAQLETELFKLKQIDVTRARMYTLFQNTFQSFVEMHDGLNDV